MSIAASGDLPLLALFDLSQLGSEIVNPLLDQPAVDFQLLFTGTAHADAHLQTRQVSPHPFQSRQRVFQLSQFDGQSRFVGLRVRRKDVENQLGAIEDLDVERFFQIAGLGGREIVVEDHDVGRVEFDQLPTHRLCPCRGRWYSGFSRLCIKPATTSAPAVSASP